MTNKQQNRLTAYHQQFGHICNAIAYLQALHQDCINEGIPPEELVLKSPCGIVVDFNLERDSLKTQKEGERFSEQISATLDNDIDKERPKRS
jgi:hypothetical protein